MGSGWITLHRDLKDHWIFQDSDALKFWVYLLLTANHTSKKTMFNGKLIEVQRGSLIGGRMSLSAKTGISERKVRRFMSVLQDEAMVSIKKTTKYSIISITNYDEYQSSVHQTSGKTAIKRPQSDPQSDPHLNNVNNVNNKKEGDKPPVKAQRFSPPTNSDVMNYFVEQGLPFGDAGNEADKFSDFYASKNWNVGKNKMKDWKAACRNWKRRIKENETSKRDIAPSASDRITAALKSRGLQ